MTRSVPPVSAVASSLPSGLNATLGTGWWVLEACRGEPTALPVAGFHNRTVPPQSAVASSLPSGLNATPITPDGSAGKMPLCCCWGPGYQILYRVDRVVP
jgi:hypothetical protein